MKVASDEEAVGFAILVNLQRGWTKAERSRIDADLQAAGLTLENFGSQLGAAARRERIRIELLEQAALEKPLSHGPSPSCSTWKAVSASLARNAKS